VVSTGGAGVRTCCPELKRGEINPALVRLIFALALDAIELEVQIDGREDRSVGKQGSDQRDTQEETFHMTSVAVMCLE